MLHSPLTYTYEWAGVVLHWPLTYTYEWAGVVLHCSAVSRCEFDDWLTPNEDRFLARLPFIQRLRQWRQSSYINTTSCINVTNCGIVFTNNHVKTFHIMHNNRIHACTIFASNFVHVRRKCNFLNTSMQLIFEDLLRIYHFLSDEFFSTINLRSNIAAEGYRSHERCCF